MSEKIDWTPELLAKDFASLPHGEGANLQKILDWTIANGRFLPSEAKMATFGISGKSGKLIISMYGFGNLYFFTKDDKYPDSVKERNAFGDALKDLNLLDAKFDVAKAKQGKNASRKPADMSDHEIDVLLGIIEEYCL